MTRGERRWLYLLSAVLSVQMVLATTLILTFFGGVVGWPWLWLSFSTFRSVRALVDRGERPGALVGVQCLGVAVIVGLIMVIVLSSAAAGLTTGRRNWLIVGPILFTLYLRAGLIVVRHRRGPLEQRRHLGPAGVLG